MTRNMATVDRCVRAVVVAPVAIFGAMIIGASTLGGIILVFAAGIMVSRARVGGSLGRRSRPW